MTKRAKTVAFPIVLKTIINDTHRDNKAFALNDKQIRSRLRAKLHEMHVKNTSWIANNQREYDAIRSTFDASYATRLANARKRAPRKSRVVATSNVETNDA